MGESILIVWFCLVVADSGNPRTVYHDRIDGLILPACEPIKYENQPYLLPVLEMAATLEKRGFHHVIVEHADWCGALHGGLCCCRPTVRKANRAERRLKKLADVNDLLLVMDDERPRRS